MPATLRHFSINADDLPRAKALGGVPSDVDEKKAPRPWILPRGTERQLV